MPGLTITDAADAMTPPMPRRELARRLRDVKPIGRAWGRKGRRAATYDPADILRAHAAWVKESRTMIKRGRRQPPKREEHP